MGINVSIKINGMELDSINIIKNSFCLPRFFSLRIFCVTHPIESTFEFIWKEWIRGL